MARTRKLITDQDFKEAQEREDSIRVFQDDHVVDSGGIIIQFNEQTVVIQSGVSDIAYHERHLCEFFGSRKK